MPRVVRFHRVGGPEVLRIEDIQLSALARDEVRIKVKAIGINRADILMRQGAYIETPSLPSGLGLEAAGVVNEVGAGVSDILPGDVVSIIPPTSMERWPAYGEFATFPVHHVVKHPAQISMETAAACWMQYLTAYGALVEIANLAAGERVLITAASSSVGVAAIQIANEIGAIPIAVTRSMEKREALLGAGASSVICSQDSFFAENLRAAGGERGFRVVFDPVAGPDFIEIISAMAHFGILIEYGGLSQKPTPFPVGAVLSKSITLRGYLVHEVVTAPARLERAKMFILDGLSRGALKPIVAATFPFEAIAEAHAYLELNEHIGKVIVTV